MRHFSTEQDVAEELFALLSKARELYQQDVVKNAKRYIRYVDDFINCHRYIDCNAAVCRNYHEMNIQIIKGLLHDCAELIEKLFTADTFSFEECMELKRKYDTSDSPPIAGEYPTGETALVSSLSFGCNFSHEQMAGIVACATTYRLFSVSTLRFEDIEALFSCKEGSCIRVNNIRNVAILFDALLENTLIQPRWQSVLDKGKFLQSKDGKRYISASNLSSALSAVRNNMTSVAYSIRKAIGRLKE